MAHELDFSNGRTNMAYVGARPWHGLGHKLDPNASVHDWTIAAGLQWEALKEKSFYHFKGVLTEAEDNYHILRGDTGASLGVMSGRYQPVQPEDVMAFFRQFILTDERFSLETAGSLKGGKVIWALAKFREDMTCAGDRHVPYVLLTTSYNGSLATTAQATMIRVVCNNTLTASVFSKEAAAVKVPHSRKWTEAVAQDAHLRLERVSEGFAHYKALSEALAGLRMSRQQTVDLFKGLMLKGTEEKEMSGKARAQFEALFQAYNATVAEGTEVGTGWTALNAVTRFVDHSRSTRVTGNAGSAADARMASAFYGSGATLKSQAVQALVDMGGLTDVMERVRAPKVDLISGLLEGAFLD